MISEEELENISVGHADIKQEFEHTDIGDERLDDRTKKIAKQLGKSPSKSVPQACQDWASIKAVYRYADNPNVTPQKILSSHQEEQKKRLQRLDKVLGVSDTTHITFPEHHEMEGLGDIGDSDTDVGDITLHTTFGVDPESGKTIGILDQQVLIRDQEEDQIYATHGRDELVILEDEQEKWMRGAQRTLRWIPKDIERIFVWDRGGDDIEHFEKLNVKNTGFIIRAKKNRRILTTSGDEKRLKDWVEELQKVGETEIHLEQKKGRKERDAEVELSVGTCKIIPPHYHPKMDPVEVNVVRIKEFDPPDDVEEPLEWILYTSESMEGYEDAKEVMDCYDLRWRIEDWHKVLKTGCRIEDLTLERRQRFEVLLTIYSIIAWKVLDLRRIARGEVEEDPEDILKDSEIAILEAKYPEIKGEGGKKYGIAVAKLGGYMDRGPDPPPGWIVIWRGYRTLMRLAEGYELSEQIRSKKFSNKDPPSECT